jgi:hypothetical protein
VTTPSRQPSLARLLYAVRVYSPSQTERHITCPLLRVLERRWRPRTITPADVAAALGSGVAAAAASYRAGRTSDLVDLACRVATARIDELTAAGCELSDQAQASVAAMPARIEKAVRLVTEADPVPPEWRLVAAEMDLGPDMGYMRPDAVMRRADGEPVVLDYKVRTVLEARYRDRVLEEYQRSWQLWSYCWALSGVLGEPVRAYAVVLVVLEPRGFITLLPYRVRDEALQQWERFAAEVWREMDEIDRGDRLPRGQTSCRTVYGPCVMTRACWTFHLDESLMRIDYVDKEATCERS